MIGAMAQITAPKTVQSSMVKIMLMMLNMMVVASFGWMVGWAPIGRNPRRVRAGERRSAAQIHITRVRASFHNVNARRPTWQTIREWIPADDAEPDFELFDQRTDSDKPAEIPREDGSILVLDLN